MFDYDLCETILLDSRILTSFSNGRMAQWLRHPPTERGIPGSNPGVIDGFLFTYSVFARRSMAVFKTNWSSYSDRCGHLPLAVRYWSCSFACCWSYSTCVFGWIESRIWWRFNGTSDLNHVVSSRTKAETCTESPFNRSDGISLYIHFVEDSSHHLVDRDQRWFDQNVR